MPIAKKTHCRCGKPKNSETTATLTDYDGYKKLHYLCKECDGERSRKGRYLKMELEELFVLRSRYYKMASYIGDIIDLKITEMGGTTNDQLVENNLKR